MQNEVITVKERKNKKLLFQTPKASYSMIPFLPHSGKGKTIGMENRSGFAKGLDWGQGLITRSTVREFLEVTGIVLDRGSECTTLCKRQNARDWTPKRMNFTAYKFKNKKWGCFRFSNNV